MAGLGRLLASRRRTRRLTATVAVLSVVALGGPLLATGSTAARPHPPAPPTWTPGHQWQRAWPTCYAA
jgi:hypothetical protein